MAACIVYELLTGPNKQQQPRSINDLYVSVVVFACHRMTMAHCSRPADSVFASRKHAQRERHQRRRRRVLRVPREGQPALATADLAPRRKYYLISFNLVAQFLFPFTSQSIMQLHDAMQVSPKHRNVF